MILRQIEHVSFDLYQHLGKLFYAIAKTDDCIRDEELKKLEEVLDNEWMILDGFNAISKAIITNTFKWLDKDNEYDANVCFANFVKYKRAHEALFSNDLKSLILKTAGKIASSFSGQNKSELIMLAKLSIEFKKSTADSSL